MYCIYPRIANKIFTTHVFKIHVVKKKKKNVKSAPLFQ